MEEVEPSAESDVENEQRELQGILDKFNDGSALIWVVFALTSTATVFCGFHGNIYVFIAKVPMHWCTVAELSQANWTDVQIRNVSSATSCTRYSYNYSYLSTLNYEEALAFAEDHRDVTTEKCTHYSYADGTEATSIAIKVQPIDSLEWKWSVEQCLARDVIIGYLRHSVPHGLTNYVPVIIIAFQWDLVCDRTALRSSVQMTFALGNFLGSPVFGVISDRFGRRISYMIGVVLLNLCGPASAFVPWYWVFVALQVLIGSSLAGLYISAFTILSETAIPKHRNWMSMIHAIGTPFGMMILSGIAYGIENWQHLQLTIGLLALVLLLPYKFLPESPRWLLSQNRCAEAKIIMKKLCGRHIFEVNDELKSTAQCAESGEESSEIVSIVHETRVKQSYCLEKWNDYIVIYSNSELRTRILIVCLAWSISILSYNGIALNGNNFAADQNIYTFVMGLAEIPTALLLLPLLVVFRRRPAVALLFLISGVALLSILMFHRSETFAIIGVALIGRSTLGSVYSVILVQTSELFPTVVRNTALGYTAAVGFAGGILSPYIVDLLGQIAWWAPSTLCGTGALIAGALILLLPETRGRPLAATVSEELMNERGRTSISNCCAL